MNSTENFPLISTFPDVDAPCSLVPRGAVRNVLLRLLPVDFFYSSSENEEVFSLFSRLLPIVKWVEWGEGPAKMSIYLICPHRVNAAKFFYEMVSRWLLPGKLHQIACHYTTDFYLSDRLEERFILSEIVIVFEEDVDRGALHRRLPILESEIRLGLISVYHANRILEIKGLSIDEKNSLIQERIFSFLKRRPGDFDYDIFSQMQHFLVMCTDEFKAIREYAHMSRIIFVFYLFRQSILKNMEISQGKRFLFFKVAYAKLHLPLGIKKVLGIFIGINLHGENEVFAQRNLEEVVKNHFPWLSVISDSFFASPSQEDRVQMLYVEVEKRDHSDFSCSEIKTLKERMPEEVRNGVEKVARPLYMPRNEEEVMRNIITLSHQLKYVRDLPQAILSFDGQSDLEISFTVVWVRVLSRDEPSLEKLFKRGESEMKFSCDRVKAMGFLRKRYPKEATVFQLKFPSHPFLRSDHSVDLFKARQFLVQELQRVLGEFRDYNGGMLAKQQEQFCSLRGLFPTLDRKEEILLENFFHSIYPIELRCLFPAEPLKNLFHLLLEGIQKNREEGTFERSFFETDSLHSYFLHSYIDPAAKDRVVSLLQELEPSTSQLLTLSLQVHGFFFLGVIYREEDLSKREQFRVCLPL